MIIQANVLDNNGFIIEPVVVLVYDVLEVNVIKEVVPNGMHTPKWDYKEKVWTEGAPLNEILEPLKVSKSEELSDICNKSIEQGFYHNGDFFQFNTIDQSNFNQQLSLLIIDNSEQMIAWKTENNGLKMFNRQEFINICKSGEAHKRSFITQYWKLKNYIFTHEFKSIDELTSIDFGFVVV